MNDAACHVFQDLINLSVRMMPIFLCLEPKQGNHRGLLRLSVGHHDLYPVPVSHSGPYLLDLPGLFFVPVFSCASGLFPRLRCKKTVFLSVRMDAR